MKQMKHLLNAHPVLGSRAPEKGEFMHSSGPSLLFSNDLRFDLEDMRTSRQRSIGISSKGVPDGLGVVIKHSSKNMGYRSQVACVQIPLVVM